MKNKVFESASFHIVKPCNYKCKFCYATFEDLGKVRQLPLDDARIVVDELKAAGVTKITFAGGEPLLYGHIVDIIKYTKMIGVTTSIITNGALLTDTFLHEMVGYLDWIGVSVDSIDNKTNGRIGRTSKSGFVDYNVLCSNVSALGYKLKINTVVNAYNISEDFTEFIANHQPERWKVFQVLRVEGQNDAQFDDIRVTDGQFLDFIQRHSSCANLVPENNEAMTGSYLLIDPKGRLFENSQGRHTYSDSLVDFSMDHCLSQIKLNREMFIKRGGLYSW